MSRIGQPGLAQILRTAIRARQADVRTSCPGIVIDYDAGKQTCTCKLAVRIPDVNGIPQELPPLTDVPVQWQRGGGYFATMPLQAGDAGDIIFSEVDFSAWRTSGEVSDATQERRHGLYAKFYPGGGDDAHPIADASADHMVYGKDGGPVIRIKPSGIELGAAASDFVALAAKVDANFKALKDMFTAWTPVATDGGAALKTLTGSLVLGAVAATKVKAE